MLLPSPEPCRKLEMVLGAGLAPKAGSLRYLLLLVVQRVEVVGAALDPLGSTALWLVLQLSARA